MSNYLTTSDASSTYLTQASANSYYVPFTNTTTDASAILNIASTTQGVILPSMATKQKNIISAKADGLIVYDTTLGQLNVNVASTSGWMSQTCRIGTLQIAGIDNLISVASVNIYSTSSLLNASGQSYYTITSGSTSYYYANFGLYSLGAASSQYLSYFEVNPSSLANPTVTSNQTVSYSTLWYSYDGTTGYFTFTYPGSYRVTVSDSLSSLSTSILKYNNVLNNGDYLVARVTGDKSISCDLCLLANDKIRVLLENPSSNYERISISIMSFV
jgi:hypothetical protein